MKIKRFGSKVQMTVLGLLASFIFVLPAEAANRNDALFDLKDAFNSPVAEKVSAGTLILIVIVCIAIVMIFRYHFTKEEEAKRTARQLYRERHRSQSTGQKRNWFRLKTDAEFKWIPAQQAEKAKASQYKIDQLMDISGGGLSFSTAELLNAEDEINMILPSGDSNPLCIEGRVIRVVQSEDAFNIYVQFIGLLDGQRDKIVAWIQKNQRNTMYIEKQEDKETEKTAETNETDVAEES